jgi:hypothetical protein
MGLHNHGGGQLVRTDAPKRVRRHLLLKPRVQLRTLGPQGLDDTSRRRAAERTVANPQFTLT